MVFLMLFLPGNGDKEPGANSSVTAKATPILGSA
jgi:hypothetical protein